MTFWHASSLATGIANSNAYIDLTQDLANGPGIGFQFSDGASLQQGEALFAKELPQCMQETLDSHYFWVFGCKVPLGFVPRLAAAVPGFQFASDKSETELEPTASQLLLANAWDMMLTYPGQDSCLADAKLLNVSKGCAYKVGCNIPPEQLIVGCETEGCEGCVLDGFFQNYSFEYASFLFGQDNP